MDNNKTFDVVIPVAKEDVPLAIKNIPYIFKMLSPRKIIFIGSKDSESSFPLNEQLEFINEDEIYKDMKLNTIQSIMYNIAGNTHSSGWYFQQFLKMSYATICKEDHYVIWDADTIPLNVISFFDDRSGKYLFTMKTEHHKPYFATLEKLFNGEVKKYNHQSFIAEHMIIDTKIMIELIKKIESNKELKGNYFYEKIMYSIDVKNIQGAGFSEFETYGNYVMKYHSDKYIMRELRSLREGRVYFGMSPTDDELLKASKNFDLISIESW